MQFPPLRTTALAFALCTAGLLLGGAGCLTAPGDEPDVEESIATVDSLIAPTRIAPIDTLRLRLRGTAGPNGCHSLARIETAQNPGRITVTPVVKYRSGPDVACTAAIVPLDTTHVIAPPFNEGALRIVVPQSDQADVTATVDVGAGE